MSDEPSGEDLLARIERAAAAAEQLIAEAARGAGARVRPGSDPLPPAGWQAPGAEEPRRELERLVELIGSVRDLVPAELQRRLAEALRELLLAARALIDWYLERAERSPGVATEVQDIPID